MLGRRTGVTACKDYVSFSKKKLDFCITFLLQYFIRGVSRATMSKMERRGVQEVHRSYPRFFQFSKGFDKVGFVCDLSAF